MLGARGPHDCGASGHPSTQLRLLSSDRLDEGDTGLPSESSDRLDTGLQGPPRWRGAATPQGSWHKPAYP